MGINMPCEERRKLAGRFTMNHLAAVLLGHSAGGPHLADVAKAHAVQQRIPWHNGALAQTIDGTEQAVEGLPRGAVGGLLSEARDEVSMIGSAEPLNDIVEDLRAGLGLLLGLARGQGEALALALPHRDGCVVNAS